MKKVLIAAGFGLVMMTSCGGATTACDCAEALEGMMKDYTEAAGDETKMEKLQKKYEKINEDCEKIAEEMGQAEFNNAIEECLN
jgi:uncharacterized protein with von Willebrand factor type A (vWA) domain